MALHPQAQGFLDALAAQEAPPLYELTPEQARGVPAALAELVGPGPDCTSVRDISIPGPAGDIPARVYEPSAEPSGTVVYYHGGGWVIGCLDDWDALCRSIAVASGCRLVSVDYRLAPEHPFPAAVEDSDAALVWIAENLAGGKPIVVAGDSAGGNLAAVVSLHARDRGGPPLALQVLVYPVVDFDDSKSAYAEYGDAGLLLGKKEMDWFCDHYLPDAADRTSPDAAPLAAADHSGLPPALILVAEYDPLRDDGHAYADKLRAAGVPVTVKHYDDQIHVFFSLVNVLDSANEAVAEVGQAIRTAVAEA